MSYNQTCNALHHTLVCIRLYSRQKVQICFCPLLYVGPRLLLDICLHVNTIYVQSLHINIVICIQI